MMKNQKLQPVFFLLLFTFMAMTGFARSKPLCLHPENPQYFAYKGKPTVLITFGEHYGAIMNTDFDYNSFTTEHPNGSFRYPADQPGGDSFKLRKQLSYLKKFFESFNFIALKPGNSIYTGGLPRGLTPYLLAETGKQYAFYLMGGNQVNPEMNLPKFFFSIEWMNPINGKIEKKERLNHSGGKVKLTSPEYTEDIALKILSINK